MEVTLRPYHLQDVGDFMHWANDEEVNQRSRIARQPSRDHAVRYLNDVVLPHPWYRAICLDGTPVGFVCVDTVGGGSGRCRGQLAYALGRRYWGQGVMTAAVRMAVDTAFEELEELERIEAVVDVENKGSQRVLEKDGFVKEGLLRKYLVINGKATNVFMYSVLSNEYRPTDRTSVYCTEREVLKLVG